MNQISRMLGLSTSGGGAPSSATKPVGAGTTAATARPAASNDEDMVDYEDEDEDDGRQAQDDDEEEEFLAPPQRQQPVHSVARMLPSVAPAQTFRELAQKKAPAQAPAQAQPQAPSAAPATTPGRPAHKTHFDELGENATLDDFIRLIQHNPELYNFQVKRKNKDGKEVVTIFDTNPYRGLLRDKTIIRMLATGFTHGYAAEQKAGKLLAGHKWVIPRLGARAKDGSKCSAAEALRAAFFSFVYEDVKRLKKLYDERQSKKVHRARKRQQTEGEGQGQTATEPVPPKQMSMIKLSHTMEAFFPELVLAAQQGQGQTHAHAQPVAVAPMEVDAQA